MPVSDSGSLPYRLTIDASEPFSTNSITMYLPYHGLSWDTWYQVIGWQDVRMYSVARVLNDSMYLTMYLPEGPAEEMGHGAARPTPRVARRRGGRRGLGGAHGFLSSLSRSISRCSTCHARKGKEGCPS